MSKHRSLSHWKTCPECGKRSYDTRADAKRVNKLLHDRMNVYPCALGGAGFHLGHLPRPVIQGLEPRDEVVQQSRLA